MIATALCIGFGFAGGVFSPALVIGVLTGATIGVGAELLLAEHSSGVTFYAICGMVAVTSPVIGGPLTAILIVFELTRNYELTTAVMISVVFSNVVAYRWFGRSWFDRQLRDRGIDLAAGRDRAVLQHKRITSYLSSDAVVIDGMQSIVEATNELLTKNKQECIVIDKSLRLVGKLKLSDILLLQKRGESKLASCAEHADRDTLRLQSDLSVWSAIDEMQDFSGEIVPIIDQDGLYMGVIYHSALLTAYLKTSANLRAEENAVL